MTGFIAWHTILVFLPVTSRKKGEDELPVGQGQQEPILHILRKQEGPFLRAGGTEVKRLTTERTEVFVLAVRIGALDTGDALGVVTAENELLHHLGDALDAEPTVNDRVLVFVLIGEALKMLLEQKLENVDSSRLIGRFLRRGELKG